MDAALRSALEALAADAESGASELLPRALEVLRSARAQGEEPTRRAARAVGAAQPSMASLWNAAAAAIADLDQPGTLERYAQRAARAPAALARVAAEALVQGDPPPSVLATCSYSGSVLAALQAVARSAHIVVACSEGRPRYEGRRLASALADAGIEVQFHTDASLGSALADADGLLVGADAITPRWFINKSGTTALAAAASWMGVPVFVVAARDKFLPASLAHLLDLRLADASEIWDAPPRGVTVRNSYFERVPLDLVTAFITDAGVLAAAAAEEACRANGFSLSGEAADALGARL